MEQGPGPAIPVIPAPGSERVPLVVDLDRALLRGDMLAEGVFALARINPLNIVRMIGWRLRGAEYFRQKVAEAADADMAALPVNQDVAAFVAGRKSDGQRIVLITAASAGDMRRQLVRFPFADEMIGRDGGGDLQGEEKAKLLRRLFPRGFDYAGGSASDTEVWQAAREMILVEPSSSVARTAQKAKAADVYFPRASRWTVLAKALRLHQWAKNSLVFAPLILSGMVGQTQSWTAAMLAFVGLGLTASATYIINDLIDLPHDRKHRSKFNRPLASGRLPLLHGAAVAGGALAGGLTLAGIAGPAVAGCILGYVALTLMYSAWLKRVPFLDTLTLASLFTLRLVIGMVAVAAPPSSWLLTFSMFLFLSLSLAKRFAELISIDGSRQTVIAGRGYHASDGPIVGAFGVASAIASIVMFLLYLHNEADVLTTFTATDLLWVFPAILFLWLARIWLLCSRGEMEDDPVAFSVRDRVSLWLGTVSICLFTIAITGSI